MSECPRHAKRLEVVRCTHIGERFVVQMQNPETGYVLVDYVEDLPDDGLIIETNDWYHAEPAQLDTVWQRAVERMRADDPPVPERSYAYI